MFTDFSETYKQLSGYTYHMCAAAGLQASEESPKSAHYCSSVMLGHSSAAVLDGKPASLKLRRAPLLDGIRPREAGARGVDAARVCAVLVVLGILAAAPPAQLVVKHAEPGVEAALRSNIASSALVHLPASKVQSLQENACCAACMFARCFGLLLLQRSQVCQVLAPLAPDGNVYLLAPPLQKVLAVMGFLHDLEAAPGQQKERGGALSQMRTLRPTMFV